jgi:uncharacterized membrane protein
LRDGSVFTSFAFPGAIDTSAEGINNAGQIVGWVYDRIGTHGFLKDGANFTKFDFPGAQSTYAEGINDRGQITGYYYDGTSYHGFLAAVPEPGTYALLLLGIGAVGVGTHRRSRRLGSCN